MTQSAPPTSKITFAKNDNKTTTLHASQWLPGSLEDIFDFFSKPENLQKLTPPKVGFQILTPSPFLMKEGLVLDYKLRVHGFPIHWTSLITEWHPPHVFSDEQLKGPYKKWIHSHMFFRDGEGTRVEDQVIYQVPGGRLVEKLIVQKDLIGIFSHRHQMLEKIAW